MRGFLQSSSFGLDVKIHIFGALLDSGKFWWFNQNMGPLVSRLVHGVPPQRAELRNPGESKNMLLIFAYQVHHEVNPEIVKQVMENINVS